MFVREQPINIGLSVASVTVLKIDHLPQNINEI